METGGNDYSYAYESPTNGHAKCNGGFESENGYKTPQVTTAVAVNTSCEDPSSKSNASKRLAFCCCLLFILCFLCLAIVVVLWLVTPLQGHISAIVCAEILQSSNSTASNSYCHRDISIDIAASTSPIRVFWEDPTRFDTDGNPVGILSQSHDPGSSFPANSETTVMYVFDDAIKSECSFKVKINVEKQISSSDACDCEPTLSIDNCPTDFIYQEPALCGTVPVVWNEPTATDGCGGDVRVEKSHTPGTDFSAGTTTITYTFTDSQEHQKSCQFDIGVSSIRIVDDTIAPRVSDCPEHIYEVLQPGQTSLVISWDPPTARDGSGLPVTLHQTHTPGDQFTVGGYELVKYTFTDVAGNEAVCEFAVTLYPNGGTVDKTPPTVPSGCNTRVTLYAEAGSSTADYNVAWSPATDNDGQTPTIIATHQEGVHSFPLGRNDIDAYYYDTSGNRARCYRILIARYRESAPVRPTVKNCPVNVYREIPEGTTTRVCFEEPDLTDEAGNPVAAEIGFQRHHPGAEFFINGCDETVVHYVFYDHYGTETFCSFSVTIRAIGHENLPGEWSQWHDNDYPSGNCDCELSGYQITATPCSTGEPVDAQCETITGEDWRSVGLVPSNPDKKGQVAYCCPRRGFACFNKWNDLYNQHCLDYRVRFKCPLPTS